MCLCLAANVSRYEALLAEHVVPAAGEAGPSVPSPEEGPEGGGERRSRRPHPHDHLSVEQPVVAQWRFDDDELWFLGDVSTSSTVTVDVKYRDGDVERSKPVSRVVPCPAADEERYVDGPPSHSLVAAPALVAPPAGDALVGQALRAGCNVADRYTELGKSTFVPEASGSHYDVTTGDKGTLIEQKVAYPWGRPSCVTLLSLASKSSRSGSYGFVGDLPAGVTGYVRSQLCWVSRALEDIDCHCLTSEHHFLRCAREFFEGMSVDLPTASSTAGASAAAAGGASSPAAEAAVVEQREAAGAGARKKRRRRSAGTAPSTRRGLDHVQSPRGAWRYNPETRELVFWPQGVAVTDWQAPYCGENN